MKQKLIIISIVLLIVTVRIFSQEKVTGKVTNCKGCQQTCCSTTTAIPAPKPSPTEPTTPTTVKIVVSSDTPSDSKPKSANTTTQDSCKACDIDFGGWVLVFSPMLIFLVVLLIINKKLKEFSIKEALNENEFSVNTIPNKEYTAENLKILSDNANNIPILNTILPPTIQVTSDVPPKSSSRYIAFITSVLTWIIGLCLSSFFIYQYLRKGTPPDLSGLSTILISLGIGVAPYAFNKIATAIK